MGQLAASISHEIKQPIASTATNAQAALRWLMSHPPNLDEVRESLEWIVKNAARAADVINRIRGLVKNAPTCPEQLAINEAILEVLALIRTEAVKNGVSVHTRLAENLPLVEGDRVQLQQVVLNLTMNAVEAMSSVDDGPRELVVGTAIDESGDVLVEVCDSGPGITPENADRLFQPFYTTKETGMGVGLSICRSIVEAHGGRISVSANEPRGAVFRFTCPTAPGLQTSAS
jgi:C4-dicarboxylate-specific signal transduction histidine kinase